MAVASTTGRDLTRAWIQDVSTEGLEVLPLLFGSRLGGTGRWPRVLRRRLHRVRTRLHGNAHRVRQLAAAAVQRYGPDGAFWSQHPSMLARPMRVWQVWSEQNLDAFFRPQADPDAYAELLAPAAEKIRNEDPDTEILIGGMFQAQRSADADQGDAVPARALSRPAGQPARSTASPSPTAAARSGRSPRFAPCCGRSVAAARARSSG